MRIFGSDGVPFKKDRLPHRRQLAGRKDKNWISEFNTSFVVARFSLGGEIRITLSSP